MSGDERLGENRQRGGIGLAMAPVGDRHFQRVLRNPFTGGLATSTCLGLD